MKFKNIAMAMVFIANFAACSKDNNDKAHFSIDRNTSLLEWKGSATDHFHTGAFRVYGEAIAANGIVTGGTFTIPIASISNYDLPDSLKVQLLDHLQNPDFFNAVIYPDAVFNLKNVTALSETDTARAAGNNYRITGDFSMIGQTHPLSFPARITLSPDSLQTTAAFKLNRLTWGMTSFNDPSKPLYILPDVEIKLNIKAATK
ncbi:YceI family protein [Pedobacter ginsengisoli]|uniref:YceI family protein n=1 Tax=Pedobacter ginsengisoli TaxID=363852 RepID=UPI00254DF527|nr:YceI family protein [Pedobacter ginsengisoli]